MGVSSFKIIQLLVCATLLVWDFSQGQCAESKESKIALIQYNSNIDFGQAEAHLKKLTDWANRAVAGGAKIIVLPEGSQVGYADSEQLWCLPETEKCESKRCVDVSLVAEKIPSGTTTRHWEAFAKRNSVWVVFHLIETDLKRYYNSVGVVGPQGFIGKYQKRSLYRVDRCYATSGEGSLVFDTPYGRFGLMICMDIRDERGAFFRDYLLRDVQALIVVTNWDEDPKGNSSAKIVFEKMARDKNMPLYVSDASSWDGTGFYQPQKARERNGLAPVAIGQDGISFHSLKMQSKSETKSPPKVREFAPAMRER